MIFKLIRLEQSGFQLGRSSVDNIIAIKEVAHSLEKDTHSLPKMMIKVDIEKTYETLEWNAILATLGRMKFPIKLIDWIKTCISSSSFYF